MCGRFTYRLTWPEIVRLYRLPLDTPARNTQPRYNVCPTDPIDVVVERKGKRDCVSMRWGLVPYWWSKPLKQLKLATFNARAETVTEKPFFREPFKHRRCLIPASGYYEWHDTPGGKQPYYFTRRDGYCRAVGPLARQGRRRRGDHLMHDGDHRAQRLRARAARPHAGDPGARSIRAVAVRRGRRRNAQAGGKRRAAAMAGVEAGEQLEGAGG